MTRTTRLTLAIVLGMATLVIAPAAVVAQTNPVQEDRTLFMNEQQSFIPGYPVGNIAIGNPKVADFRVLPGRRELLLVSKGLGQTTLTVWDQKNVKRHEVLLTVTTRQALQTENELKELLKDFPGVRVATLAGSLVVTGTVSSEGDVKAIDKIASAAKAKNLVRLDAPAASAPGTIGAGSAAVPTTPKMPAPSATSPTGRPLGVTVEGATAASGSGTSAAGSAAVPTKSNIPTPSATPPTGRPLGATGEGASAASSAARPNAIQVDYEIELLEASTKFRSGSYARGIEPSGRSLYKGTLRTSYGTETEIFIGGGAVAPAQNNKQFEKKQTAKPANGGAAKPVETGIRLKLRPDNIAQNGQFTTFILVETNLPIGSDTYDPDTWRRARWEFKAVSGEPFGITGGDLMATPDMANSGSALGTATRTASRARSVPGVSSVPGMNYVPVFGSLFGSKSYQAKTTQLLVILRPKFVVPGK